MVFNGRSSEEITMGICLRGKLKDIITNVFAKVISSLRVEVIGWKGPELQPN